MSKITVVNKSTVVTDSEAKYMVAACNKLLPLLAAAWNILTPNVVFSPAKTATGNWYFYIIDSDADVPGALAFHTEESTCVDGYILAQTILTNGGVKLFKDMVTPTIASALFHEIAEALVDPTCNGWWQSGNNLLYATEVCDPVQDTIVPVTLPGNVQVGLSNFIYPLWRDMQAPVQTKTETNVVAARTVHKPVAAVSRSRASAIKNNALKKSAVDPLAAQAAVKNKFDYCGVLSAPFSLTSGGYYVTMDPTSGNVQQVFGEKILGWVKEMKTKTKRISNRKKQTDSTASVCTNSEFSAYCEKKREAKEKVDN
jgi:hypothetical protein